MFPYPISPPNPNHPFPKSPDLLRSPPKKKLRELKATDSPLSGFGTLKRFLLKPDRVRSMVRREISWENKISFAQLKLASIKFASPLNRYYRALISNIEQFVNEHIEDNSKIENTLKRIKEILGKDSYSPFTKFAQISLLYYYLERDQQLPNQICLLQHRLGEIKEEVTLLQKHAFPSIHSCIQTYLLRTFCNMALFADGTINHGGVITVLVLTNGELSTYFKDDHLHHIRTIFRKLIEDAHFQSAIEEPLDRIAPAMEKFLKIDCKIPIDETITPQHIRQFCLLALLHDLRQYFLQNCYSVATLSYGIHTSPERILCLYKQLIVEGEFEVSPGIKIAVGGIAIDRLIFDPDLDSTVNVSSFLHSTLFQTIARVAKINYPFQIEKESLVLRDVLKRISVSSNAPLPTYALSLLTMSSYKRNILQELVLTQMEFLETNRTQHLTRRDHSPRAVKGQVIKFLHLAIFQQIQDTFPDYMAQAPVADFFVKFKEKMERRFWLQDCSKQVKVEGSEVTVNNLNGTGIQIKCNNSEHVQIVREFFSIHRRLLYIEEEKVIYVEHLDTLRKVIKKIVKEVLEEDTSRAEILNKFGLFVNGYIMSMQLREALGIFLQDVNKFDFYFSAKDYSRSGIIGFKQDGGVTGDFPVKTLGITTVSKEFSSSMPDDNFLQLFKYLHNHTAKPDFLSSQKWILCCSQSHAFLMQPATFSPLWNEAPPQQNLFRYGWNFMKNLLTRPLMRNQMLTLLHEVYKNPLLYPFNPDILPESLPAYDFWQYFNQYCKSNKSSETFDLALFNLLTRIPIQGFSVKKVLYPDSPDTFQSIEIDFRVQQECSFLSQTSLPVLQLAGIIQRTLNQYGNFYTINQIEREICLRYQLPLPWVIGDLNWGNYQEAPQHHLLIMRPVMNRIMFFTRKDFEDSTIIPQLYSSFRRLEIFYV